MKPVHELKGVLSGFVTGHQTSSVVGDQFLMSPDHGPLFT